MIIIDGSFGEGGGQVLRTSLSLAAALGVAARIEKVRARRVRPGLRPQHAAAARAVAEICSGRLTGTKTGATEVILEPGRARAGRYSIHVGTAGSTALIFQTLLPVLALTDAPSSLSIYGGTHNPLAPPADFISECFLPVVRAVGLTARCELSRHGFAPKGGGELRAEVEPWRKDAGPLTLTDEVDWEGPEATILIANLPDHVAFRERDELSRRLRIEPERVEIQALAGELGPGNAVLLRYRSRDRTALITGFGEPRKSAERVAQEAAREAKIFARSRAPVDPHLADQLLLPLALGPGGTFDASAVTEHARANAHVIGAFLGIEITFTALAPDRHRVSVPGKSVYNK